MTIHRAMVLAAGRGTRLGALTSTLPKPLMPVGGRPLLDHILTFLAAGGIDEVVINLHHLGDMIEEHVGDGERFGLHARYSWEEEVLDTGGGIKRAEALFAGEPFVVMNGDSLLDMSLREVIAFHEARGGVATLAVRPDPAATTYGLVEIDDADRIRRIAGAPPIAVDEPLRDFMFPGLHILNPEIFSWMEAGAAFGIVRVTYPRMIQAGVPLFGCVTESRWINIDTPAALAAADETFRHNPFRF